MPQGIAITFPSNPTEGQTYLAQNGFTYIYSSLKNQWKRGGDFVRAPKVLSFAGVAATTTGAGVTTGPLGGLIYNVPGFLIPSSDVGVDSYKAYRYTDSYPNYTEIQVSISSAFSTIAYAATSTSTTFTIPANTLSGNTRYYVRARQFVGSSAGAAGTGAISGYSQNIVSFATTSVFLDTPTIVSIAGSTRFPVYQIGFAGTTLPATVTYTGSGLGNLQQVEWRVTGPRNPDSTGDVALAEVGIGTLSSATLANALVLAMPFSGATGVGITNDVNNAIRTASGASAGTTKTVTINGNAGITTVGIATTTAHFYNGAANFGGLDYLTSSSSLLTSTSTLTVEAWLYLDEMLSYNDPIQTKNYYTLGYQNAVFRIPGTGVSQVLATYNGQTDTGATTGSYTAFATKSWFHAAWVIDNGLVRFYKDGALLYTGSTTNNFSDFNNGFQIGRDRTNNNTFKGKIQDLKVYNGLAKYTENFTPPLPTYGTISYTTRTIGSVGVATTAFFESTGDIPTAEASSTAANALVLAMPMNRTFGFQDINVAVRGLTSGASAGTAKTVGLGTTSTANAPSHPIISSTESKWYDGAAYFYNGRYALLPSSSDYAFGTGDYTIEGWFYRGGTTGGSSTNRVWIGTQNIGVPVTGFLIFDTSGTLYYYQADNTAAITTTNIPPLNTWNHLAVTRSGTTVRMFINGVLIASATSSVNHSASNSVFIGGDTSGSYYFEGYMQDLKIYKGFAKYTANFTPPQPICGFTTDLSIQTGFTTTSATGALLSSVVGLGSTSTLAFGADQNLVGVTSITSSSGITTLPDPYAQNLVLALPLANITGVGNSFTNDRNTQIRSVSLVGAGVTVGVTKTVTNSGVTTVSVASTTQRAYSSFSKFTRVSETFVEVTHTMSVPFTIEGYVYLDSLATTALMFMNTTPHQVIGISLNRTGSGDTQVFLGNGSGWLCTPCITSSSNITAGKWWHIALVCDGIQTRLYHDGNLVGTTSTIPSGFGSTYRFGRNAATIGAEAFDGYMQDLRVYNIAKYTTNFTPPPPMFGDYVRSTPNRIVFTPGSDYALEARNTATGGIVTSTYSATRQWGTKPKGGIYDTFASNLVLAIPGGAVGGATSTFDVTGQIRFETPTTTYVNAGIVTYSNSYGTGTYTNKSITNTGPVSISSTITKYYSRSMQFTGTTRYLNAPTSTDFGFSTGNWTIEMWVYPTTFSVSGASKVIMLDFNGSGRSNHHITSSGFLGMYNGASDITTTYSVSLNTWNHFAWVKSNGILYIFANGVSVYSASDTRDYGSTRAPYVGSNDSGAGEYFNGHITDIRIYKGVAKYTSNFTPPNQIFLT